MKKVARRGSDVFRLLARIWTYLILAIILGLWLTTFTGPYGSFAVELGKALIVAAMIGALWHVPEVRSYFVALVQSTLVEHRYLERQSERSLRELRNSSIFAILGKWVQNDRYVGQGLAEYLDDVLLDRVLPTEQKESGIYREELTDWITLETIDVRSAISEAKAVVAEKIGDAKDAGSESRRSCEALYRALETAEASAEVELLRSRIMKRTTIRSYAVISPRLEKAAWPINFYGKFSDVPLLPPEARVRFYAGADEQGATELPLTFRDLTRGGIEVTAKSAKEIPFTNGVAPIWTRTVEYTTEPFMANTMVVLTKGIRVYCSVVGEMHLVFDANVIGFGASGYEPQYLENGVFVHYPGWLFEDHGYIIWWWDKSVK